MRFRGPAIATFLQRAEENLALLGAQIEGPGLSSRASTPAGSQKQRSSATGGSACSSSAPAKALASDSYHEDDDPDSEADAAGAGSERSSRKAGGLAEHTGEPGLPRASASQRLVEGWLRECSGGRGELREALTIFADSEREVKEQMDIQARTLLGIDRKVKAFDGRLRVAADEAACAAASSARLQQHIDGMAVTPAATANACSIVAASADETCSCGITFPSDAVFCNVCGAKRHVKGLLPAELAELRGELEDRLNFLDGALAESQRGEWVAEAARGYAHQTSTDLVGELSRKLRQQLDDFHSNMEARYEQRFAMLDVEIRHHATEVAQDMLDEFMRGPALQARVDALLAGQAGIFGNHPLQALDTSAVRPKLAEGPWVARADFIQLEAQVGALREELAMLELTVAGALQGASPTSCVCGSTYLPDSDFCRQCGTQRPVLGQKVPPSVCEANWTRAGLAAASTQEKPAPTFQERPPPAPTSRHGSAVSAADRQSSGSVRQRVAVLEEKTASPMPSPLNSPRHSLGRASARSSLGGVASQDPVAVPSPSKLRGSPSSAYSASVAPSPKAGGGLSVLPLQMPPMFFNSAAEHSDGDGQSSEMSSRRGESKRGMGQASAPARVPATNANSFGSELLQSLAHVVAPAESCALATGQHNSPELWTAVADVAVPCLPHGSTEHAEADLQLNGYRSAELWTAVADHVAPSNKSDRSPETVEAKDHHGEYLSSGSSHAAVRSSVTDVREAPGLEQDLWQSVAEITLASSYQSASSQIPTRRRGEATAGALEEEGEDGSEHGGLELPSGDGSATAGEDLVIEDALQEAVSEEDGSSSSSSSASSSPVLHHHITTASIDRAPTIEAALVATSSHAAGEWQREGPASEEAPSMELWDSLLMDIQDNTHVGELGEGLHVGGAQASQSPCGVAVLADDGGDLVVLESSASSHGSSSASSSAFRSTPSGLPLPMDEFPRTNSME